MARALVDPAELRRFAKDLHKFNLELEALVGSIKAKMTTLETSWRDQEQKKFSDEFTATLKVLSRFNETSQQHVQVLMQKAGHIESYLNQR